jgi:hypothetical protein
VGGSAGGADGGGERWSGFRDPTGPLVGAGGWFCQQNRRRRNHLRRRCPYGLFRCIEIEILYISNRLFVPSLHLTLLISSMDNYFLLIPSPFGVCVNLNMDNG